MAGGICPTIRTGIGAPHLTPTRVRHVIVVIVYVDVGSDQDLLHIIQIYGGMGLVLGFGEGRQQHPGQNRDNSDYHQQFDQGESTTPLT